MKKILGGLLLIFFMFGCTNTNISSIKAPLIFMNSEENPNDNYIFDAERIKKVFCGWEFIKEEKMNSHYMRFYNKEKDIYIDISNYAMGDTPKTAQKRFYKSSIKGNFKYSGKNEESKKILNQSSYEYIFDGTKELAVENHLFFNNVKISIVITNGDKNDYIETLKLVKEAIDPAEPIKNRKCLGKLKYYHIDEMFDISKLEKGLKEFSSSGRIKKEINGDEDAKTFISDYTYHLDYGEIIPRGIRIENNKNFSGEVMKKRWHKFFMEEKFDAEKGRDKAKYLGEDKISVKYFGVPAKKYEVRALEDIGLIQYRYVIATDKYTIITYNYKHKTTDTEYENLLKIIYKSLILK